MDALKQDQLAEDVRKFHALARAYEGKIGELSDLLWMAPEAPIREAAWNLIRGYIDALDRAWGIGDWLLWWWEDLVLGEKASEAALPDEEMRPIRTIDDLVQIILDDLQQAEEGQQ